jgi:2-dehydro-3-deoxyphosphogluconate aldolase / (4S)-4-hydroxy-2-oxoglutarate aldolase
MNPTYQTLISQLETVPFIPVVVLESLDHVDPLVASLQEAQINIIEITLRTEAGLKALHRIHQSYPDILLAAGTVITLDQLKVVMESGAQFAVAPGLNPTIVGYASSKDFPFIPGVMTPSEVERALELGCSLTKFFPAEAAGGTAYLKALAGPYDPLGVRFIPTGGIDKNNIAAYTKLTSVLCCGVSYPVKAELIREHKWEEITNRCLHLRQVLSD